MKRRACPQCAGDTKVCSDHSRLWYPQRTICYATMELAAAQGRYNDLHKDAPFHDGTFPDDISDWSPHRTEDTPYHFLDGVNLWVSLHDLSPGDHFLGGRRSDDDEGDDPAAPARD